MASPTLAGRDGLMASSASGWQHDAELREVGARRQQLRQREHDLRGVEDQALRARHSLARWQREAGRAADRLASLGGFGLLALWRRYTGHTARQRDELQQKLEHARRQHDEVEARLEPIEAQLTELRARRDELAPAARRYAELLQEKELWLREQRAELAPRLDASRAELQRLDECADALNRSIAAGRSAEGELLAGKELLRRSQAMGHVSLGAFSMGSGGRHRKLAEATSHLERARRNLEEMSADLRQHGEAIGRLEMPGRVSTQLAALLGGGVVGLLSDMRVLQSARRMVERIDEVLESVRDRLWQAEKQRKVVAEATAMARAEREQWLEAAG